MKFALEARVVEICGHSIPLDFPRDTNELIDAALENDQDPYWGTLWNAAIPTAECVLQSNWRRGQSVLELGCGLGLVGIAALLAGCDVTFSDVIPDAVELSLHNARQNGFRNVRGCVLDWHDPTNEAWDMLLASDVLYDEAGHIPLLDFARSVLTRTNSPGQLFIGDPGRSQADAFLNHAASAEWKCEILDQNLQSMPGLQIGEFQLLKLTSAATDLPC